MRILLTGHTSFVLMKQFYPMLQAAMPEAKIALYGLNKPGGALTVEDRAHFGELIEQPLIKPAVIKKAVLSGRWLGYQDQPKPWKKMLGQLLTLQIRPAYETLYEWTKQQLKEEALKEIFAPFDLINIHYCAPGFLQQLNYVRPNQKAMLSFWGSDLFQETGIEAYSTQLQALEQADAITLHSPEMEQIFLSKFGRSFQSKVHQVLFGCHQDRFDTIEALKQQPDKIQAFKNKHQIPNGKTIVQIGYSGGAGHQHLAVIEALTQQVPHLKEELFLMVPTTYNNQDSNYFELLKTTLENSIFASAHLTDYLTDEEVLLLPVIADVHLNIRDADALNNAMTEALYTGCWVIVGAWLPYGVLRRAGLQYSEVAQLSEIPNLLANPSLAPSATDRAQNARVAVEKFAMHHRIAEWVAVYKHLYQTL
ncbi:MAG: hypothetical protein ACRBFS_13410 [Aureispira sp.]